MKLEYRLATLKGEEKELFWAENVKVVETFLTKYGRQCSRQRENL